MKDFIGFRFGNIHTKDLNLVVVSSSDRYQKNLLPDPKDYTVEVPGGDGSYYFGQTYNNREFSCEVAFDNVTEDNWRKISQLFSTDKLQDLVFDELPYKTYKAKLRSKPEFKFICFTDRETGERVYKGEGTLNFICYFPYAFGFNKYIVRAADYYNITPPETIIRKYTEGEHEYADNLREPIDKHTKDYYDVKNNHNTPWKGGYPTIEQVQNGALYFNRPDAPIGEPRCLIDVRGYWENIPEWAPSSKLLTTPTLDYDQELIYMPQYSRENYINMDIAIDQETAMIGSRMLVYNPGDLPIDFNMDMFNNDRTFHTGRGDRFQLRRFNVQRLTIPNAVDWVDMRTYLEPVNEEGINENTFYRYGDRYFRHKEISLKTKDSNNNNGFHFNEVKYTYLNNHHPNHTYIAEPIPRETLGKYIRIFCWQSLKNSNSGNKKKREELYKKGYQLAERYEELRALCINEYEEYELYWRTLKDFFHMGYADKPIFHNIYVDAIKVLVVDDMGIPSGANEYIYLTITNLATDRYDNSPMNLTKVQPMTQERVLELTEGNSFDYKENVFFEDGGKQYYLVAQKRQTLNGEEYKVVPALWEGELPEGAIDGEQLFFRGKKFVGESQQLMDTFYKLYVETDSEFVTKYRFAERKDYTDEFDITFEDFYYNFIWNPPEFIRRDFTLDYGQVKFNKDVFPQWIADDYLEMSTEEIEDSKMYLDTEKRLLYNQIKGDYFYEPNIGKTILNDNIVKGKWFKIPPGWSLIELCPVCDEDNWGGKRWTDARPFDWGYGGTEKENNRRKKGDKKILQLVFDEIYTQATNEFLLQYTKDKDPKKLQIRRWFFKELEFYKVRTDKVGNKHGDQFSYDFFKNLETGLEYKLLKLIANFWNAQKGIAFKIDKNSNELIESDTNTDDSNDKYENIYGFYRIKGNISEWWWYACNYIWANFPPLYWGYADLLNRAKIYYTPLFY